MGSNDNDQVAEMYKLYGPAIYACCRRMLNSAAAAEDASQETFVRVQRYLVKAPDTNDALRWIYRIATNYCLNEIRDRRLRPILMDALPDPPAHAPGEGQMADRDLAQRLIARAPEHLRAAAWLYYLDGFDQSEVANILGVSRRTVIKRLDTFARNSRKFWAREAA
jgi:RNA polymerase sigma-70 factor (ECF subfamily)